MRIALWGACGVAAAVAWFVFNVSVGLENRFRGDAVEYFALMMHCRSVGDLLTLAGERTLGFPLYLYAIRLATGVAPPLTPSAIAHFVNVACVTLLIIHLAATIIFFLSVAPIVEEELATRVPGVLLALLLAYPGLVAYTAAPLTDTLAADLLMVALACVCRGSPAADRRRRMGLGAVSGLALGMLVLVRPASLAVAAVVLGAGTLQAIAVGRKRLAQFAVAAVVAGALVGWQAETCTRAYGAACLVAPEASRRAIAESVGWGTRSARHYWSSRSTDVDGAVVVEDRFLVQHLGSRCAPTTLFGRAGLLRCLAADPLILPPLFVKKAVGLFDSYYLQPYAVDVTPRWARLLSRPFGALAFAGFVACCAWLVLLAARPAGRTSSTALLCLVAATQIGWQSLFHVEPRYGFGTVPLALLVLVATVGRTHDASTAHRRLVLAALLVAAGGFLWQTHRWDVDDAVLHQIEGNRRAPVETS